MSKHKIRLFFSNFKEISPISLFLEFRYYLNVMIFLWFIRAIHKSLFLIFNVCHHNHKNNRYLFTLFLLSSISNFFIILLGRLTAKMHFGNLHKNLKTNFLVIFKSPKMGTFYMSITFTLAQHVSKDGRLVNPL